MLIEENTDEDPDEYPDNHILILLRCKDYSMGCSVWKIIFFFIWFFYL